MGGGGVTVDGPICSAWSRSRPEAQRGAMWLQGWTAMLTCNVNRGLHYWVRNVPCSAFGHFHGFIPVPLVHSVQHRMWLVVGRHDYDNRMIAMMSPSIVTAIILVINAVSATVSYINTTITKQLLSCNVLSFLLNWLSRLANCRGPKRGFCVICNPLCNLHSGPFSTDVDKKKKNLCSSIGPANYREALRKKMNNNTITK